ncbi:MAG: signal peptidase I [Candidatus Paceibacterota bacterium]
MDDSPKEAVPSLSLTKRGFSSFKETLFFFILAMIIVVPIRVFIAQPYIVSGSSMHPTFDTGDYLIVDELTYRLQAPSRGDVIIFRFPLDPSKFFIKRIIALPNETITIHEGKVWITPKNEEVFLLPEEYILDDAPESLTQILGSNEYFVLGDNRLASLDSRVWGVLPQEKIVGRAFLRLFPPSEIDYLPGKTVYFSNNEEGVTIE